jgi:hypothetical protein
MQLQPLLPFSRAQRNLLPMQKELGRSKEGASNGKAGGPYPQACRTTQPNPASGAEAGRTQADGRTSVDTRQDKNSVLFIQENNPENR